MRTDPDVKPFNRDKGGFSLVEVSLAVMVVALGLTVLFGLFPSAIREGELAFTDTQAAFFGDFVLSGMHANAPGITWSEWNGGGFNNAIMSGITVGGTQVSPSAGISQALEFPAGSGNYIKYILEISGSGRLKRVSLWAWSGKRSPADVVLFKRKSKWFYTEFFYGGGE